jgi:hypothetical protein
MVVAFFMIGWPGSVLNCRESIVNRGSRRSPRRIAGYDWIVVIQVLAHRGEQLVMKPEVPLNRWTTNPSLRIVVADLFKQSARQGPHRRMRNERELVVRGHKFSPGRRPRVRLMKGPVLRPADPGSPGLPLRCAARLQPERSSRRRYASCRSGDRGGARFRSIYEGGPPRPAAPCGPPKQCGDADEAYKAGGRRSDEVHHATNCGRAQSSGPRATVPARQLPIMTRSGAHI